MADKVNEVKEAKDSVEDNAVVEDSKKETKNGEEEDEEESSDEEEHAGLYDKPVVIEGKRERKTTIFLASQTPQAISIPKPLLFVGKGESLGSMERTNYELGRSSAVELKPLHKLLFGREGRAPEIKRNIRKFNGFVFEKDSKEYEAKKFNVERFTNDGLKRLCEIFDLEKKGIRVDLQEKVMDFLMSPKSSGRPAPKPKAKKSEKKKKRKRSKKEDAPKSKTSAKSKKSSETVESGDEEEEDEEEEVEEEKEEEEPPKKKKKTESMPKKTESPSKKSKETKVVKEKGKEKDKSKDKPKAKAKKTEEKTKASKKKEPVAVKITPLKKRSPKKTPKKEKPAPVEVDSSDEEPLAKMSKKEAPTNSDLEKLVKELLDGADLEKVTMKSICKQVYDKFPGHDLTSRKDFIKGTVRKVIS